MTTTRIVRGLQSNVIRPAPQTTAVTCKQMTLPNTAQCRYLGLHYIALNEITEDKKENRLDLRDILRNFWEILFPEHGSETYHRLEGDTMTPVTAYKSGNRYYVADDGNSLATARYLGQAYVLAQVWELH